MVDPVGGVGGVQDTEIFPDSITGEAVTEGGAGASIEQGAQNSTVCILLYSNTYCK